MSDPWPAGSLILGNLYKMFAYVATKLDLGMEEQTKAPLPPPTPRRVHPAQGMASLHVSSDHPAWFDRPTVHMG